MKTKKLQNILIGAASVLTLLVLVLAVHIYMVTRPKVAGANTKAMARIDIKQDIDQQDADNIASWLYKQKGVDHVLCNAANDNVVFSFFPVKNSADQIVKDLRSSFHLLNAERYVPTEKEIQAGCPIAATPGSYKVISFFKKLF